MDNYYFFCCYTSSHSFAINAHIWIGSLSCIINQTVNYILCSDKCTNKQIERETDYEEQWLEFGVTKKNCDCNCLKKWFGFNQVFMNSLK